MLRWLRHLDAPPSATPATTFAICGVIAACAAAWLCGRLWRGAVGYRRTGAEIGGGLLILAAAISTVRSGQKHLASIGVIDWLGLVLFMLLLRQLLDRPWRIRMAVCAVLATGAVVAVKCAYQRFYELPATIEYYQQHKAALSEPQGESQEPSADAGFIHDYEQRLQARSVSGYFQHPNVLGSFMILIVMTGLAVAVNRFKRRLRSAALAPIVLAILAGGAMVLTQSKGAVAALCVALAFWGLAEIWIRRRGTELPDSGYRHRDEPDSLGKEPVGPVDEPDSPGDGLASSVDEPGSPAVDSRPSQPASGSRVASDASDGPPASRRARVGVGRFVLAWLGGGLVAVALVGLLSQRPEVMGRSMLFRSLYWRGAWNMLVDRGLWGVGADNFGRLFTRYKPVECPEDVDDPHSWVMKMAVEWGVVGLAGLLALLVGVSWRLVQGGPRRRRKGGTGASPEAADGNADARRPGGPRRLPQAAQEAGRSPSPGAGRPGSIVLWLAGLGSVAFMSWASILWGANPAYLCSVLVVAMLPWAVGFFVLSIEGGRSPVFSDDETGSTLCGIAAGLVGFLLHSGIDLALFSPGAATTFFALMAVALAIRGTAMHSDDGAAAQTRCAGKRATATAVGIAAAAVLLAGLVGLRLPAARLADDLRTARLSEQPASWEGFAASDAMRAYEAGVAAYPLDSTACNELAEELLRRSSLGEHLDRIDALVATLRRRDPLNAAGWQLEAGLHRRRFDLTGDAKELEATIGAMQKALKADPTSPRQHTAVASQYETLGQVAQSPEAFRAAADAWQRALDLDARRVYVSKPNRFSDAQRQAISATIESLRSQAPSVERISD